MQFDVIITNNFFKSHRLHELKLAIDQAKRDPRGCLASWGSAVLRFFFKFFLFKPYTCRLVQRGIHLGSLVKINIFVQKNQLAVVILICFKIVWTIKELFLFVCLFCFVLFYFVILLFFYYLIAKTCDGFRNSPLLHGTRR